MLDHYGLVEIKTSRKRVVLHVRSVSKRAILFFRSAFGGEIIRKSSEPVYLLRYRNTGFTEILSTLGPYCVAQQDMLSKGAALIGLQIPYSAPRLIGHYVAGAIDARGRFGPTHTATRIYPTFSYTYYSEEERVFLGASHCHYRSIRWTFAKARAALERVSPFCLDADIHARALSDLVNEPFDESILSHKDRTFYEAETARLRTAKESAARVARLMRAWPAVAQESRRKLRQQAYRAYRMSLSSAAQQTAAFRADHREMLAWTSAHDYWWSVAYRKAKPCTACEKDLSLDCFPPARTGIDGLSTICKRCQHARYVTPKLAIFNARTKAWVKANPEKVRATRRKQARRPQSRIRRNIGKRIKKLLGSKRDRYCDLIGCSPAHLHAHLTGQLQPGMTWENYGRVWHVDHRLPVRAFDLRDKQQRLACFHYTNLQPLWSSDNARKSDLLPDGRRARDVVKLAA